MSYEGHPPFNHNPHVYEGVDPDGNPTDGLVVHSTIAPAEDIEPVDAGSPTFVGESGPEPVVLPEGQVVAALADDADTDVDGDGQVTGYELFTKDELVAHIKGLNETRAEDDKLPVTGNKPDLVKRIQEAEAAVPEQGGE